MEFKLKEYHHGISDEELISDLQRAAKKQVLDKK